MTRMPFRGRSVTTLLTLLGIAVAVWASFAVILYLAQDRLIFQPTRALASDPSTIGLEYEDVSLQTPDGQRLHAWFIPAEDADGVMLFLHGNAGNISHRLASLEIFNRLGLSTLIIDYRGYGDSQGEPSEQGTYNDAETAWNYLTLERDIDASKIIIFGRSLGGAVGAWLGARVEPAGVILESVFVSLESLAKQYYPYMPIDLLLRSRYPTREYIAAINAPILLIHSREDELIPFHHAQQLQQAGHKNVELRAIQGGHDDGFVLSGQEHIEIIRQFKERVIN